MLENPPWHALNTEHARLAVCAPGACRYPADIAPFAGTVDNGPEALRQLAGLLAPGETVYLMGAAPQWFPELIPGEEYPVVQMVAERAPLESSEVSRLPALERLTEKDAPEMMALTSLAFPGFFRARTYRMGVYFGIRVEGQLIAMGGERMALPGYREVSGVCTHPAYTGRGYAARLVTHLQQEHAQAGVLSYLHAGRENSRAIALYERLGFRIRKEMRLHQVSRRPG